MQNSKFRTDHPLPTREPFQGAGPARPGRQLTRRQRVVNLGAAHENLDHKAYRILKAMIMERQLLPGDKIPQEKLADELGISRTPLVNALKFLEHEKLVQSIPRRGFFVRLFSLKEMVSIFELREVLEGLSARRAARNVTDREIEQLKPFFNQFENLAGIHDIKAYAREDRRFHNFITDIGAKEFLRSILETYNIISFSYQWESSTEGLVRPPDETIHEHRAIIQAICRRDEASAEQLMRRHLSNSAAILRRSLETQGG
jgi:DNA-binding GntR family transcriptional regulator